MDEYRQIHRNAFTEMVRRLQPESIIFHGNVPEECTGNIMKIKAFQDSFRKELCEGGGEKVE